MLIERRQKTVSATPAHVYRLFAGISGKRGWPSFNCLWGLRGLLDRLVGGMGMPRGRRHPDEVREGDALDFWSVKTVKPGRLLRLQAAMKLLGQG
jgi:hypothetical protein